MTDQEKLNKSMAEIDAFVKRASDDQLRAKRDWGSYQIELGEYAIRCINDELERRGLAI